MTYESGSVKILCTLSDISAGIKKCRSSKGHHLFTSVTVKNVTNISEEIEMNPQKQLELEKQSEKYRNEGNTYFKKAMYMHAYQVYTRSIASALHGPVCALAYANRSAALFYMASFEECLLDITEAIANGYQENLLYKLYLRQARSLNYLGKSFKQSVKNSIKAIELHNKDAVETLKALVDSEMKQPTPVPNPKYAEYYSGEIPPLSYGVSAEVPCFSSAISVAHSKEQGRYLVANRDIEFGDVLIVEDPIAAVVDMDKTNKMCCRCFKISYTLKPCDTCRQFMYCSKECKKLHWKDGHKDECKLINQVLALSLEMHPHPLFFGYKKVKFTLSCLVLSLITHCLGLEKMEAAVTQNEPMRLSNCDPRTRGFDSKGKFTYTFEALLSLKDNFNKLTQEEKHSIVHYASQAVLYTPAWKNLKPDLRYGLTALYIKLFLITAFNYKPVTIFTNCENSREALASKQSVFRRSEVGFALYLASSLINHSCSPNVYKVYYGTKVVFLASKSIKKGDQINESMYLNYLTDTRQTRQQVLQEHYRFTCKCEACKDKWPTAEKLSANMRSTYFPFELNKTIQQHVAKTGFEAFPFTSSIFNITKTGFPDNQVLMPFLVNLLKDLYSKGHTNESSFFCQQIQQVILLNFSALGSRTLSKNANDIITFKQNYPVQPSLDDSYADGFFEYILAGHVPLETNL